MTVDRPASPGTSTVVLGGARSGKSAMAVRRGIAHERSGGSVVFVATCPRIAGDADLDQRIVTHQAERPATWATVEQEIDLAGAVSTAPPDALVIVDCLTLWVSNLMHAGTDERGVMDAVDATIAAHRRRCGDMLSISNEVGLGIVPINDLARRYRDLLGRVNQRVVAASDEAYLMVAGRALPLIDIDS